MTPPPGIAWWQLVALMAVGSGAEPTLSGVVRVRDVAPLHDGDPPDEDAPGETVELPGVGLVRVRDTLTRLHAKGDLARSERRDGRPLVIRSPAAHWVWLGEDSVPTRFSRHLTSWGFLGDDLVARRSLDSWSGTDFTRPTGPAVAVELLGRPAWRVELAPPSHKPFPLVRVVDAETGLVLSVRNDGFGSVTEWVELEVGADLPDALFRWDGPTREPPDREVEHDEDMAERTAWLAERGITDLVVPVPVTLLLHEWDDDGSFFASLTSGVDGSLARRPHTEGRWEHGVGWEAVEQWSDGGWDWVLATEVPLPPAALRTVQEQLARST